MVTDYLMNPKVGVRVEIVVSGCHLFGIQELCHLSPARTARLQRDVDDGLNRLWDGQSLERLRRAVADLETQKLP